VGEGASADEKGEGSLRLLVGFQHHPGTGIEGDVCVRNASLRDERPPFPHSPAAADGEQSIRTEVVGIAVQTKQQPEDGV
jgi:hypothetical protein